MTPSGPTIWASYRDYLLIDCQRAPRTVSAYRWIIWDWFSFLGEKSWHRAGKQDLHRYLDRATRSGRAHGRNLGPNARLHYAATITAFYAWCYAAGHLRRDPMAAVKLPKGGVPRARSFKRRELRQILLAAEPDPRLHLMCWLGYGEGLRCGEIAAARVEDVDLYGQPPRLLVHGKGGKTRLLPVYPQVRSAIVRMLSARGNPRVGPLVESRRHAGASMTPGSVSRALSDHIRSLDIDGSGHGLRHSFATELLAAAGEEHAYTLAKLMGHVDTKLIERLYALRYPGKPDRLLAQLPNPRHSTSKERP
jgi:integrase/recombinase XerC